MIDDIKDKIIKDIIHDSLIVRAIDANVEYADDLIDTRIFKFNQNPNSVQQAQTFITIQVHIPRTIDRNKKRVETVVEIWIISNNNHMVVNNIPKIKANRNDLISQLLDEKFNGRDDFGIGELLLERSVEGIHPDSRDYVFRQMIFKTKDFNQPVCR